MTVRIRRWTAARTSSRSTTPGSSGKLPTSRPLGQTGCGQLRSLEHAVDIPIAMNPPHNQLRQALQQIALLARQGIAATDLTMRSQPEPVRTINAAVGEPRVTGRSGMAFGAGAHRSTSRILAPGAGMPGSNGPRSARYGYSR
jgi:hypothetical protein